MLRKVVLLTLMLVLGATAALAGDYNYVEPAELKGWLTGGKELVIVDIQVPDGFAKSHFKGAIETNAFPVKSDEERQRLDKALAPINATKADVIVVCPKGMTGAKNAYDYLKGKGVNEKRLFILGDGMLEWPYPELTVNSR